MAAQPKNFAASRMPVMTTIMPMSSNPALFGRFEISGGSSATAMSSVQLGGLQQAGAVGRQDAHIHLFLVARHLQHDFGAGRAAGPDASPQRGEARDRLVADRQDMVSSLASLWRRVW